MAKPVTRRAPCDPTRTVSGKPGAAHFGEGDPWVSGDPQRAAQTIPLDIIGVADEWKLTGWRSEHVSCFAFCSYLAVIQSTAFKPCLCCVLHIRTTSWSSNQPTLDIWLATLSASFVYTITARLR